MKDKLITNKFEKIFTCEKVLVSNNLIGDWDIHIQFIAAEFIIDFGPWQKGSRPYNLTFDPLSMRLYEGDQWGLLSKDCAVALIVKD